MASNLKYKRNWMYEQMVSVHFVDGSEMQCFGQTDNKGRISYIRLEDSGDSITPELFGEMGIREIHFMTPAKLEVKTPTDILVSTYLKLGRTISEGDSVRKASIRSCIAAEIHKRGLNLHELMATHTEA